MTALSLYSAVVTSLWIRNKDERQCSLKEEGHLTKAKGTCTLFYTEKELVVYGGGGLDCILRVKW